MKKWLALVLCCCMFLSVIPALADVADDIKAGEALSHDELVAKAAAEIGTEVIMKVPRDPMIQKAEDLGKTVVEAFPDCEVSRIFKALARKLVEEE